MLFLIRWPAAAAALTTEQIGDLLIKAGRQRSVTTTAQRLYALFQASQMRQPAAVEWAFGRQALALLRQFNAAIASCEELAAVTVEAFEQHPDAQIIASFPGLGTMLGARLLGELGDDRSRFPDARALKCYAGSAPVTRASGKSHAVFTAGPRTSVWPPLATSGRFAC